MPFMRIVYVLASFKKVARIDLSPYFVITRENINEKDFFFGHRYVDAFSLPLNLCNIWILFLQKKPTAVYHVINVNQSVVTDGSNFRVRFGIFFFRSWEWEMF